MKELHFSHIKDGDYTCEQWFKKLYEMERKSKNGDEITIIRRNDMGFACALFENGDFVENVAIFRTISEAYSYTREYLIKHKQTGFYIV